MSSAKDWRIRVEHILEAIRRIQKYIDGLTEESFGSNPMAIDAVVWNLQIIGEAVRHIPGEVRTAHPNVPWRDMRHLLVHRYEMIDVATVWTTARNDLAPIVPILRLMLSKLP